MKLQSDVPVNWPKGRRLSKQDCILSLGSCFSSLIGQNWIDAGLAGAHNPFGVLFNPESVLQALHLLDMPDDSWIEKSLFQHLGLWRSFAFHSVYSSPDRAETLTTMHSSLQNGRAALTASTWLFITWGTALAWYHQSAPQTAVANCHRRDQTEFECRLVQAETIVKNYSDFLEQYLAQSPDRNVLLTVSPIRHPDRPEARNTVSKAHLHIAAEALCRQFPGRVLYFPAFEILTDELRDYRFYGDDFSHPSPLAERYVLERFLSFCTEPDISNAFADAEKRRKAANHRPNIKLSKNHEQITSDN